MINPNELRIGNIILYEENEIIVNPSTIYNMSFDVGSIRKYDPILLTGHTLIELGFKKGFDEIYEHDYYEIEWWGKIRIDHGYLESAEYYFLDGLQDSNRIKYVHEFQNFFYALTGKELTFK